MHRSRIILYTLLAAMAILAVAPRADADSDPRIRFKARLFGASSASAQADYRERQRDDGLERRFKVEIEDAASNTTFEIYVNGVFIDTVTTNNIGRAEYKLRSPADDSGDDWLPMPADFPFIESGDTVVVGALSGVFFQKGQDAPNRQRYKLRVDVESGNDQAEASIRYRERLKNGLLERRFQVEIEDANEGEVWPVYVNGLFVAEIVINDDDEGKMQLRTPAFIDDPGDGDPMPDWFPSLVPGDVVQVGDLVGILEID